MSAFYGCIAVSPVLTSTCLCVYTLTDPSIVSRLSPLGGTDRMLQSNYCSDVNKAVLHVCVLLYLWLTGLKAPAN